MKGIVLYMPLGPRLPRHSPPACAPSPRMPVTVLQPRPSDSQQKTRRRLKHAVYASATDWASILNSLLKSTPPAKGSILSSYSALATSTALGCPEIQKNVFLTKSRESDAFVLPGTLAHWQSKVTSKALFQPLDSPVSCRTWPLQLCFPFFFLSSCFSKCGEVLCARQLRQQTKKRWMIALASVCNCPLKAVVLTTKAPAWCPQPLESMTS